MIDVVTLQWGIAIAYIGACLFLILGQRAEQWDKAALLLTGLALLTHFSMIVFRGLDSGQIPIVTRYEDYTVDAFAVVAIYLLAQWRWPQLRRTGVLVLPIAALGVVIALNYSRGVFPMGPALRTNWLIIHAQLNSLAIGFAVLTAASSLMLRKDSSGVVGRLMSWTFLSWAAMVAAGSYWASIAWGRFWGWDPIECWSLATILAYACVLHLRFNPAWANGYRSIFTGLIPFGLMMFTTYALVFVMRSVHGQYVFQ